MRVAIAAVVFVVGCSSSSNGGGSASSPFAGTWTCQTSDAITYSQPPGATPVTIQLTTEVDVTAASDGQTIAANTVTDGGKSCSLQYAVSGTTATLKSGQTCNATSTALALSLAYSNGTATVNGNTMNATLSYSVSGTLAADGGSAQVAGTGTTTYSCTK